MQRPPLFKTDSFIYWKNRFETYVKAKDLDLWHIILNGNFPLVARNENTQVFEVVPFEQQDDDLKRKLAKNNKAKMVLYNALPKKDQIKDNKIDLLGQQYEQFTILEKESTDSGFARFNTIITSLKTLDEGFSSKNYVRKFLRAIHPKWRTKVTAIKELKDLSSLALRRVDLQSKTKKESSDDETSTSRSDDKEYVMVVRNFNKFFRRKGKFVRQPREEKKSLRQKDEKKEKSRIEMAVDAENQIISFGDWSKTSSATNQKRPLLEVLGSDRREETEDKTNDETCLMAQLSHEVTLDSSHYSDNASSLDDDSMQI
ncbi:hypothetical protein Tco_1041937 [Tanacetum coccineum]|uniref:DUF4219 domain-containing protein n=1 Tax=Tanacetum coccineum TaxID=301880 RepID=A0ABQ5GHI6_9ASTR